MKLTIAIFLVLTSSAFAVESTIEVKTPDYGNSIDDIALFGDKIICATLSGLVTWDRKSLSYEIFEKFNSFLIARYYSEMPRIAANARGQIAVAGIESSSNILIEGSEWSYQNEGIFEKQQICLFADSKGTFWGGTDENGFYSYVVPDSTVISKVYTAENGLLNVADIEIDSDGIAWFGTNQGIYSYDGTVERHYTEEDGLVSDNVKCLISDDGAIWAGTNDGLSHFDGETWTSYTRHNGLLNNRIFTLLKDPDGNIWVATYSGVSRFDGESWVSFTDKNELMDNRITSMALDSENRIWFCSEYVSKGITVYDNGEFIWYTKWSADAQLPTHEITAVGSDSNGTIWIGWHEGIARLKKETWVTYSKVDGLAGDAVKSIQQGRNGTIWVEFENSANVGYSHYEDGEWETRFNDESYAEKKLNALYETGDGDLWLASTDGVQTIIDGISENYDMTDRLLSNTVYDIDEGPDGALWLGTGFGLSRYDGNSWRTYSTDDGLISNQVDAVEVSPNGTVWCLSQGSHLCKSNGDAFTLLKDNDDPWRFQFSDISVDEDGTLWGIKGYDKRTVRGNISAHHFPAETLGLYSYDGTNMSFYPFPDTAIFDFISPRTLLIDDEHIIWVATDAGLARFDGSSWSLHTTQGPVHGDVKDIAVDLDNVTWFATKGGISSLDGSSWRHYPLRSSREGNELSHLTLAFNIALVDPLTNIKWFFSLYPEQKVYTFNGESFEYQPDISEGRSDLNKVSFGFGTQIDHDGVLWQANDAGVHSYDGQTVKEYTAEDGMFTDSYSDLYIDRNNVKWFVADTGGLTSYDGVEMKNHIPKDFSLPRDFDAISEDSTGKLWLMKREYGIYSYDGSEWKKYGPKDIGGDSNYRSMTVYSDDTVWVSYSSGISVFDGVEWGDPPGADPLDPFTTSALHTDRNNRLWLIGSRTISVYDGSEWLTIENSSAMTTQYIYEDMDGSLWCLGTETLCSVSPAWKTASLTAPNRIVLYGSYPNPFNAGTAIEFELSKRGNVDLYIYNMLGQKVRSIRSLPRPIGKSAISWDGTNDNGNRVSSGSYFYRLKKGGVSANGRMMFVK